MNELTWRKSSYSSQHGDDCVELATSPSTILVRDSKNPEHPTLAFGRNTFSKVTRGIRATVQ
ncbi:DUF397 domain-containing protein [Actinocorallia lasiicapitis]